MIMQHLKKNSNLNNTKDHAGLPMIDGYTFDSSKK
jgi:hypothetical protein